MMFDEKNIQQIADFFSGKTQLFEVLFLWTAPCEED